MKWVSPKKWWAADALVAHPLQDGENPSEPPGEGFDLLTNKNNILWRCNRLTMCVLCLPVFWGYIPSFPKMSYALQLGRTTVWKQTFDRASDQVHMDRGLSVLFSHMKAIILALMLVESWRTKRIMCFDLYSQSSSFMWDLEVMQYWVLFIKLLKFHCETLKTFSDNNERFLTHFSTSLPAIILSTLKLGTSNQRLMLNLAGGWMMGFVLK